MGMLGFCLDALARVLGFAWVCTYTSKNISWSMLMHAQSLVRVHLWLHWALLASDHVHIMTYCGMLIREKTLGLRLEA